VETVAPGGGFLEELLVHQPLEGRLDEALAAPVVAQQPGGQRRREVRRVHHGQQTEQPLAGRLQLPVAELEAGAHVEVAQLQLGQTAVLPR
jgi:hypothetical protein